MLIKQSEYFHAKSVGLDSTGLDFINYIINLGDLP